jgi:hypothetical protein
MKRATRLVASHSRGDKCHSYFDVRLLICAVLVLYCAARGKSDAMPIVSANMVRTIGRRPEDAALPIALSKSLRARPVSEASGHEVAERCSRNDCRKRNNCKHYTLLPVTPL